ncbi:MAG TPA: DinB family protein [Acidimicrobiales bacterium]|nr:DinB family protein [Acidimicrobiales bacterium]
MTPGPSLDALRSTVADLVALTSNRNARDLNHVPQRGEWSAAQVAAHMADAEMVYSVRIRMMLTDDNPSLAAYDQDAWADRLTMCDESVAGSIGRFRMLREANLRLYESLETDEWDRVGTHEEQGLTTIKGTVETLIGHDRAHLDQIRKLLP